MFEKYKEKSDELKSQCEWFIALQIHIIHWNYSLEHNIMKKH